MQLQCKDGGKLESNVTVAGNRNDTLAWRRLTCHMRRRMRLAGLQRPRAASTASEGGSSLWAWQASPAPMAPTECAAGLQCVPLWCSAPTLKWNVRICSNVYAYASQKSTLPQSCVCASPQRCLSRTSMRSSSLLARAKPDTLCQGWHVQASLSCAWKCG